MNAQLSISFTRALARLGVSLSMLQTGTLLAQQQSQLKEPIAVTTGAFHKVEHQTNGTATIYEFEGGARELRIKDLETGMGPDVHVYLVADGDAKSASDVKRAGFIDLGKLKKRMGDSTYVVPKE